MKKVLTVVIVVIIAIVVFFPKLMSYSGGFTGGGTYFNHCIGFVGTHENKGQVIPDGMDSVTYCVGIPFK